MSDILGLTSAFVTASGLFFAALGAAATYNEPLKVFLSVCALVMSIVWLIAGILMGESSGNENLSILLGVVLPALFGLGWVVSLGVHGRRWAKGLKGPVGEHQ